MAPTPAEAGDEKDDVRTPTSLPNQAAAGNRALQRLSRRQQKKPKELGKKLAGNRALQYRSTKMATPFSSLSPPTLLLFPRSSQSALLGPASNLFPLSSSLTKLEPPAVLEPSLDKKRETQGKTPSPPSRSPQPDWRKSDFYLNLGVAVRTLREDLASLFSKDLNYDIYREDITFIDPQNTFQGIENYQLIFWALRFYGRILFREIGVEVFRIWQPSETSILIRWELQGVPRVPWEAKGRFQGTSRYKLDRKGKIYEHKVDNLVFNLPQIVVRPVTVLDFAAAAYPPSPNLTFLCDPYEELASCSWLELYKGVRGTLVQKNLFLPGTGLDCLVGCL